MRSEGRRAGLLALLVSLSLGAADAVASEEAKHRATPADAKPAVADYWTKDRMLDAEPRALPTLAPAASKLASPRPGRGEPGYRAPRGLGGRSLRVPGDYGTYEVPNETQYPGRISGKVFGRDQGGDYSCSATVVNARSNNLIFTAAHCVRTRQLGWANKFVFVPAFRHGDAPFGRWSYKAMYLPRGWSGFNHDYAAVTLLPLGGKRIEKRLGAAAGFAYNVDPDQDYDAFGYPSNYFNANRMMGCYSPFLGHDGGASAPIGINCRMGSGASGGGWLIDDDQYLNSVTSYGYNNRPNELYGPYFKGRAFNLLRWAESD